MAFSSGNADLGHEMADFPWDIVFWAVLAVVIGSAVFFVLGRRLGAQALRQEHIPSARLPGAGQTASQADSPKPPPLPEHAVAEKKATEYGIPASNTDLGRALASATKSVDGFSAEFFLKKAEDIFARTIKAYACADKHMLETVLSPAVFESFSKALARRSGEHEQVYLELRRIERLDYVSAVGGETAEGENAGPCCLTVRIISWQVSYGRDEKDVIIEGTEALTQFRDCWSFEYGADGQWRVVATAAG